MFEKIFVVMLVVCVLSTAAWMCYEIGFNTGVKSVAPEPEARTFYAAVHSPTVLKLRYQF